MSITTSEMTPADIRACTCGNDSYGNGGMWGGDWFAYLLLFALLGGGGFGFGGGFGGGILPWLLFGNGGFGGFGNNCGVQEAIASGFNNSAVLNSLNDIKMGQAQAINYNNQGFNGLNTTILTGFNGVERGFCDLSHQIADCCCGTKQAIADVKYTIGQESCETRHAMYNSTRDIIDNANANSRAILDALTAQRIAEKDDRIAAQQQKIFALELAASQANQNAFITANQQAQTAELIRRLGADCPQPAFLVNGPTPINFPVNACGQVQFGGNCCNPCGGSF